MKFNEYVADVRFWGGETMGFLWMSGTVSRNQVSGKGGKRICIRPGHVEDLCSLKRIDSSSFPDGFWSSENFLTELRSAGVGPSDSTTEKATILVAVQEGESEAGGREVDVIGIGCLRQVLDEGSITYLAVDPKVRGNGIGSLVVVALLKRGLIHGMTTVVLEVSEKNVEAIRLYEKMGFQAIGSRKGYYGRDVAAVVMRRSMEEREHSCLMMTERKLLIRLKSRGIDVDERDCVSCDGVSLSDEFQLNNFGDVRAKRWVDGVDELEGGEERKWRPFLKS